MVRLARCGDDHGIELLSGEHLPGTRVGLRLGARGRLFGNTWAQVADGHQIVEVREGQHRGDVLAPAPPGSNDSQAQSAPTFAHFRSLIWRPGPRDKRS